MICWPGASKFIKMIPNLHSRITRFNPQHRYWVDNVMRWITIWKRTLSTMWQWWKNRSLCWVPKAVCPTILLTWLADKLIGSRMLPLTKPVVGEATWCTLTWAIDYHQEAVSLPRDNSEGLWCCKLNWLSTYSSTEKPYGNLRA